MLISILMYFLFISKIAVYNRVRFIVPIYCITFIEFYSLLFLLIKKVIQNKYYSFSFSLIFLIIIFIFGNEWKIFLERNHQTSNS